MRIPTRLGRRLSPLVMSAGLPAMLAIAGIPPVGSLAPTTRAPNALRLAQITEERLPEVDLPSPSPNSVAGSPRTSPPDAPQDQRPDEWDRDPSLATGSAPSTPAAAQAVSLPPDAVGSGSTDDHSSIPGSSPDSSGPPNPDAESPAAIETSAPPALDLSAANIGPDLGAKSLEPEIKNASTPARAASLRLTEQARLQLGRGQLDEALRNLARAVSIDPGNPFEYYYLGRAYLARKNYSQAMTFFHRAELGFALRPDWLGETLSFEGLCLEQMGRSAEAARAYQRAAAAAPGNFRAQAGFGRTGANITPPSGLDLPPPSAEAAAAAPATAAAAPPPSESAPPPPD
jgi:hypothetical protein